MLAPAGTPAGIVPKIATEVVASSKMPDAIQQIGAGAEEYAKAIASENARMATAIKAAEMNPE